MIIEVTDESELSTAAKIHSESWIDSHKAFCSEEFTNLHTLEHQKEYLQKEIDNGARLYILIRQKPVGIVTVNKDLIENLYVLTPEHNKGYGTELLLFAIGQCTGTPRLWILENNKKTYSIYSKHGFHLTGNKKQLSDTLSELEMER